MKKGSWDIFYWPLHAWNVTGTCLKIACVSVIYPMRVCLLSICIIYVHRIDTCSIRIEACLVTIDISYFPHLKSSLNVIKIFFITFLYIHEENLLASKHKKYLCYEKSKSLEIFWRHEKWSNFFSKLSPFQGNSRFLFNVETSNTGSWRVLKKKKKY